MDESCCHGLTDTGIARLLWCPLDKMAIIYIKGLQKKYLVEITPQGRRSIDLCIVDILLSGALRYILVGRVGRIPCV